MVIDSTSSNNINDYYFNTVGQAQVSHLILRRKFHAVLSSGDESD